MNKELEEAKQNLIKQLKNTKIANECGLVTKGEFSKDIKAIQTLLNYIDNSISKEVIEEKIEEIRKARDTARDLIETKVVIADNDSLYSGQSIAHDYDINILKELLEQK